MSRHLLPLSILILAAAVAFHAIAPAHAADAAGAPPKCVPIKSANLDNYNAAFQGLYAEGARDFVMPGWNVVCGWR
jgi:hypothetical protein